MRKFKTLAVVVCVALAIFDFPLLKAEDLNLRNDIEGAASSGNVERLKVILKAYPKLVNAKGSYDRTPLHWAAQEGQKAAIEFLLSQKADINAQGEHGMTALHWAATKGYTDIVKLLLDHKADVEIAKSDGGTALLMARHDGHKDIEDLLLQHGAKECSDISLVAWYGDVERLKKLIKDNPESVNSSSKYGTPLNCAVTVGCKAAVEVLLANKADVNANFGTETTALDGSAWLAQSEIAEVLLSHNAKIGKTTLFIAIENIWLDRHAAIVRTLLAHKADVNIRRENGDTPLHVAAATKPMPSFREMRAGVKDPHYDGDKAVVDLLLAAKADPNAVNKRGLTPLHYAAETGHKAVVESLLAAKADINIRANDGKTALMLALNESHADVAELLKKAGAKE